MTSKKAVLSAVLVSLLCVIAAGGLMACQAFAEDGREAADVTVDAPPPDVREGWSGSVLAGADISGRWVGSDLARERSGFEVDREWSGSDLGRDWRGPTFRLELDDPDIGDDRVVPGITIYYLGDDNDDNDVREIDTIYYLGDDSDVREMVTAAAVSAGGNRSKAVTPDGSLWSWGFDLYVYWTDRDTPTRIMNDVIAVCDSWHTMAIRADGSLWGWGINRYGQLGDGTYLWK